MLLTRCGRAVYNRLVYSLVYNNFKTCRDKRASHARARDARVAARDEREMNEMNGNDVHKRPSVGLMRVGLMPFIGGHFRTLSI